MRIFFARVLAIRNYMQVSKTKLIVMLLCCSYTWTSLVLPSRLDIFMQVLYVFQIVSSSLERRSHSLMLEGSSIPETLNPSPEAPTLNR